MSEPVSVDRPEIDMDEVDRKNLTMIADAVQQIKTGFLDTINRFVNSRNAVTATRAATAFQRFLEFCDILQNYRFYVIEQPQSQTVATINSMLRHFSNPQHRSFTVFLGVKTWVTGLSTPIAYHVHIRRTADGGFKATGEIGYCVEVHRLD